MARRSTASNKTKKTGNADSTDDSEIDESPQAENVAVKDEDAPVVIDAEAEGILEEAAETTETADEGDSLEAESDTLPVLAVAQEPKKASILPLIGGGIIAGGIGFLAANMGAFGADTSEAIDGRIDELAAEIQAFEPTDTSPLTERLDAISVELETIQSTPVPTTDGLVERIEALENDIASNFSGLEGTSCFGRPNSRFCD